MKRTALLLLLVLLVCLPGPAFAEPVKDQRVLDAFDLYMLSLRDGDYDTMASLMHPGELNKLKSLMVLLGKAANDAGQFQQLSVLLGGHESVESLQAAEPDALFSDFMAGISKMIPQLGEAFKTAEVKLLGQVKEGEDDPALHLVYRMKFQMDGVDIQAVDVSTMRLHKGSYYFLVDEQAQGILKSIKKQLGAEENEVG